MIDISIIKIDFGKISSNINQKIEYLYHTLFKDAENIWFSDSFCGVSKI